MESKLTPKQYLTGALIGFSIGVAGQSARIEYNEWKTEKAPYFVAEIKQELSSRLNGLYRP